MRNGVGGPSLARHKRKGPALAAGGHRRANRPGPERTYVSVPGRKKPGIPHDRRPVNPGDYLTWGSLNRNVNAAAGQKFGAAIASNAAQQTRDAGWYDQYRQQVLDAQQRQQAAQAATVAQMQNLADGGTHASTGLAMQQFLGAQADAANRGARTDPQLKSIAGNAALIRQALTDSFGAQLANMGQAENNYLGQQGLAAGQAKLEHLGQLSAAGQQLLRDQGDFKVTYRDQLRADSHKRALENKAFNLNVAEAGSKAQAAKQHDRTERRKAAFDKKYKLAQLDIKRGVDPVTGKRLPKNKKAQSGADALNRWKLEFGRKHGYLPRTGPSTGGAAGGTKPQTLQAQQKFRGTVQKVISVANGLDAGGKQRHKTSKRIMSDPKAPDQLAVSVALDLKYDGHISRANARRLRQFGIDPAKVGTTYKQWVKVHPRQRHGGAAR